MAFTTTRIRWDMFEATLGALSTFYPDAKDIFDVECRWKQIYRLIAKVPTIAAFAYRHRIGMQYAYPDNDLSLRRQLSQHDVQDDGVEVQARPGAGTRLECALHSSRRSRTELQHQRDAQHRQRPHRSVFIVGRRGGRALWTACTAAPTRWCCAC